ncbi:amino acid permease [Sphingomonas sp. 28-63-12]|uniref:amino acid permease n=1 Tax=Sphingomonas sp. 28-63-12 TaxID=1970434 RepID=UPI000BD91A07|nr:MAG: amino acid permease [Sphingomonas sp. 28-63-12]
MGLWSKKTLADIGGTLAESRLHRHLGFWDLTLMGVGGTIGAGIFVLTGTAAANYAGPAVTLSFLIAAIACLCTALCYAELASMIPVAGSAYTYTYVTLGEIAAWTIGWTLVLEYLFSASTVAVGWSAYLVSLLGDFGVHLPALLVQPPLNGDGQGGWRWSGAIVNLPAMLSILALTGVLHRGVKSSAIVNALVVTIKLVVILLVIGFGAMHINTANWHPFVPANTGDFGSFGWSGVVRAAGVVFFAYIGFDMVSTSAQEARNPGRDIPRGILAALAICTILYVAMCLVLTGIAPYQTLGVASPVYAAIAQVGPSLAWLRPVIGIGAVLGLASAILMTLYGQVRIFYIMAHDGLLPARFARVDEHTGTPVFSTWFVGIGAALVAGVLPIEMLGELVSIGTLLAFVIVCGGVVVLRRLSPALPRSFRAPWLYPVAAVGIGICLYMMVSLPGATWIRLVVWMAIGGVIYAGYGRRHSRLAGRR